MEVVWIPMDGRSLNQTRFVTLRRQHNLFDELGRIYFSSMFQNASYRQSCTAVSNGIISNLQICNLLTLRTTALFTSGNKVSAQMWKKLKGESGLEMICSGV
jgi:hypothetical protein